MASRLRAGFAQWRRMGPRAGTAAAVSLAGRSLRTPLRRAWLRRRPLTVSVAELHRALAGDPRAILRGQVLSALPTVAQWERDLADYDESARQALLARAEAVAGNTFDLLGSGPTSLGAPIDWAADFKTGRRWPLSHISQLPIVFGDGSDIKVPWELSRCQHLPLLAAAHRLTGEQRWVDEIGSQIDSWIESNPVEFGPNWACTMDVAIRAANWLAALAMVAGGDAELPWLDRALASLLLHGRFIRSHLEWAPVRGNHYLSDIAGLIIVSGLFQGSAEGRAWTEFAARELTSELGHQVRDDGCDHEASIPYHRLVTELFICGLAAVQALAPRQLSGDHGARLQQMLDFTADYTRPDGFAPQVGDADDGRFLPLGDYGSDPRSHLHLFSQADRPYRRPSVSAAYPSGGYWVMRAQDLFVLIRCGDVGVGGLGSHAHNDALSFELALAGQPLVIDPGSYLYTADPVARNRFRSTEFHSTLQIDGAEQNPLSPDALFAMEDRRGARALSWSPDPERPSFAGLVAYPTLPEPATHTRRFELDGAGGSLQITDQVESAGAHQLQWTFVVAPCEVTAGTATAVAAFASGTRLAIEAPGVEFSAQPGWWSPSYGRRLHTPFIRGRKAGQAGHDTTTLVLRLS